VHREGERREWKRER
jgi:hypothetical protein